VILLPYVSDGEVAGEGALLAEPFNTQDIAGKMRELAWMDEADRSRRMALLQMSILRFRPELIQAHWRDAFAEYLSAQS
jgi:hypothetical protein